MTRLIDVDNAKSELKYVFPTIATHVAEWLDAQPTVRDHVRAGQQHPPCETCGHDNETGDTECKIKHYVSYCSNHTELDRLKGVE